MIFSITHELSCGNKSKTHIIPSQLTSCQGDLFIYCYCQLMYEVSSSSEISTLCLCLILKFVSEGIHAVTCRTIDSSVVKAYMRLFRSQSVAAVNLN